MKLNILAAAVIALLAAGASAAEQAPKPCLADAEKFCKDIKPGDGRLLACLKAHEAELSAECKAKGLEVKAKAKALAEACKDDRKKFCKDVKGGHGEKLRCLEEHEKELSEGCKAAFAGLKEERLRRNPCQADIEKLCKDVKQGEGRVIACLKQNEAALSEACKAKQAEQKENREERKKEKREHRAEKKSGAPDKPEAPAKPE